MAQINFKTKLRPILSFKAYDTCYRTFNDYKLEGLHVTVESLHAIGRVNSAKKLIIYKNLISHIVQINFETGLEPV